MQLFLGGTCAGKQDCVRQRFPDAQWQAVGEALFQTQNPARTQTLPDADGSRDRSLVVHGWLGWLAEQLGEQDNQALRRRWQEGLAYWADSTANESSGPGGLEVVLIVPEVGRGIVPVEPEQRRLRDLAGWLAQDAGRLSHRVWYVRHGLVMALKGPPVAE